MERRHTLRLLAAGITAVAVTATAHAEVDEVKLVSQFGIGYMQLTVMEQEKLVEKHLQKAGLDKTKVTW